MLTVTGALKVALLKSPIRPRSDSAEPCCAGAMFTTWGACSKSGRLADWLGTYADDWSLTWLGPGIAIGLSAITAVCLADTKALGCQWCNGVGCQTANIFVPRQLSYQVRFKPLVGKVNCTWCDALNGWWIYRLIRPVLPRVTWCLTGGSHPSGHQGTTASCLWAGSSSPLKKASHFPPWGRCSAYSWNNLMGHFSGLVV